MHSRTALFKIDKNMDSIKEAYFIMTNSFKKQKSMPKEINVSSSSSQSLNSKLKISDDVKE